MANLKWVTACALCAFSVFTGAQQTTSERDVVITAVATSRACINWKPQMGYALQNLLDLPDSGLSQATKEQILLADTAPEYQAEIQTTQAFFDQEGGAAMLPKACALYEPAKKN